MFITAALIRSLHIKCKILYCKHNIVTNFDVSLTVHRSVFSSVINQLDAQNFCFTINFISGIIKPIGVMIPEAV